jgi:hypothetical protein
MESIKERLEYLRAELRAERISYGELCELQSIAGHIDSGDVELLEAAGVPENQRATIIEEWSKAEQRLGKYVNLDKDTLSVFMICPPELLAESIRSRLIAM